MKIDNFLRKHLEKYRINILNQIRLMDSDKIIHLWLRLYKYENTETSHINKRLIIYALYSDDME